MENKIEKTVKQYKESYKVSKRVNTNLTFDVYIKTVALSHPKIINGDIFDEAFPEIMADLRADIKEMGLPAIYKKVKQDYKESA